MEAKRELTVFVTGGNAGGLMVRSRNIKGKPACAAGQLHCHGGVGGGGGQIKGCATSLCPYRQRMRYAVLTASIALEMQVQQSQDKHQLEHITVVLQVKIVCDLPLTDSTMENPINALTFDLPHL